MPIVWSNDSQVKLHIAGRSPSKKVVELSNLDQRIKLFKNPINIENHIYESTISLAPMISGSGQQFKIIEAMALSKPVISTSKASNPFGLEKNYNVLISDNAIDFADSILKLLNDEKLYFKLISNCRNFIEKNHCWESLSKNLIDQLEANI